MYNLELASSDSRALRSGTPGGVLAARSRVYFTDKCSGSKEGSVLKAQTLVSLNSRFESSEEEEELATDEPVKARFWSWL